MAPAADVIKLLLEAARIVPGTFSRRQKGRDVMKRRAVQNCAGWVILLMVGWGTSFALAQVRYVVMDMGACVAGAIANDGTMAGSCVVGELQMAARGTFDQFRSLGVAGRAKAQGQDGVTVGYSGCFAPGCINQEASLWDAQGTLHLLSLLPGGRVSAATSQNRAGLVSWYADQDGRMRAGYSDATGMHPLPDFGANAFAEGIDDANELLVTAFLPDGFPHALKCDLQGSCIDLQPQDAARATSQHLTSTGLATATVYDKQTFVQHAARGTSVTGLVRLADPSGLSFCNGMGSNRLGQTVGSCIVPGLLTPVEHGVLWGVDGTPADLNTVLANSPGWVVNQALSINDTSMITAVCTTPQGVTQRGCLLVPELIAASARLAERLGLR
jgi:hypothetical protein